MSHRRRKIQALLFAGAGALAVLGANALAQGNRFSELHDEYEAAMDRGEVASVTEEFLPRFQAAAEESGDRMSAAPFLAWILQNAGLHHEAAKDALVELLQEAPDTVLATVAEQLPFLYATLGPDVVGDALNRLAASEDLVVQSNALYARALVLTTEWGRRSGEAELQRAAQEMVWIKQNIADPTLRARAAGLELVPRSLNVGEKAPEILGLDLQGVPFRLSDYRGKVVVLDFWGDW